MPISSVFQVVSPNPQQVQSLVTTLNGYVTTTAASQAAAATSETNAATSETNAAASAAAALVSQNAAANSATSANSDASAAASAATASQTAATSSSANAALTSADATQTAADRVQTGLDRVATAADAVQTAADRVQTGLDVTSTGASAAAALSSRNAAATSETNASASATAAAADAASTAADVISTAADAASTAADAIATAADRVQTGLDATSAATFSASAANSEASASADATATASDRVQTGLDAASTAADAIATAADRVQTGLDATSASNSASAASTSATAAAASQVSAASSAASAAAVFNDFEDRYYGPHASDSAAQTHVTGLGLTVDQGDLYFNSTANEMRVYDGGSWVAASSAGGASLINYNYTATASQTAFSGSDDNANTLSYTVDNLIVTRNGVVLEDGTDYTATDGSTITLAAAAAAGDEINVVAFKSFTTADMVSATNGGTFQSNVTVNGTMTATAFSGDGSALTNLPAAGISDVVQDTTPQLGGNLDTNNNDISFNDTSKLLFGNSNDLQIYHDGSNSIIKEIGTGDLIIGADNNIVLSDSALAEVKALFTTNGAVTLYYDNVAKLATTATGVDVTGTVTADVTRTSGANTNAFVLSDNVTGAQTSGFGTRIVGLSNNGSAESAIGFEAFGGTNNDTGLGFYTQAAAGGLTRQMTINSIGNVGIGTASPAQRLHIAGSAVQFQNTQSTYLQINTGDTHLYTAGSHPLRFGTNSQERLRIDSSGRVTTPYQPAFLAYLVNSTTKATGVSSVPGTFATRYNVGGHYSTSTKRFTAPVAGLYLFTGTIATQGSAGSFSYLSCEFWVNGSRIFIGGWQGNSSPSYSKSASSVVLSLSASDYVELACETNKTFNMQGGSSSYTYFNGYLVG